MSRIQRLSVHNAPSKSRPSLSELISSSDDSAGEYSSCSKMPQVSLQVPDRVVDADDDIDLSTYKPVSVQDYLSLPKNSKVLYIKTSGKRIQSKFFKSFDRISDAILVGFYTHDRRNYLEKVINIKQLFVPVSTAVGGARDALKGTLELSSDQWRSLNRDTIVSYQKTDGEWVYRAKFNAFVKSPKDQSTRMSMTSEKGYSFTANPDKIDKMYRHLSSNDKTLSIILQTMKQLEQRLITIEKKTQHMNARLDSIEKRFQRG